MINFDCGRTTHKTCTYLHCLKTVQRKEVNGKRYCQPTSCCFSCSLLFVHIFKTFFFLFFFLFASLILRVTVLFSFFSLKLKKKKKEKWRRLLASFHAINVFFNVFWCSKSRNDTTEMPQSSDRPQVENKRELNHRMDLNETTKQRRRRRKKNINVVIDRQRWQCSTDDNILFWSVYDNTHFIFFFFQFYYSLEKHYMH